MNGWLYESEAGALTYAFDVEMTGVISLASFSQLTDDNNTVSRETADYYFQRVVLWMTPVYIPALGNNLGCFYGIRLGVIDTADAEAMEAEGILDSNTIDAYVRILQEDYIRLWPERGFVFEGGSLVAEPSEAADGNGFPVPQPVIKWDIAARFGVREDQTVVLQHGPLAAWAEEGDQFELNVVCKALLAERRQ